MQKERIDKQAIHQPNREYVGKKQDALQEALLIVDDFHNQPEFFAYLNDNGVDPADTTSSAYAQQLAEYSTQYCKVNEDLYTPEQTDTITLLASTRDAIHSHKRLAELSNTYKVRRLAKEEYREIDDLKPRVITYNHRLSSYIQGHGDTEFDSLTQSLAAASLDSFPHDQRGVIHAIIELARGAQAEATASNSVTYRPDIFQIASEDQDRTGADQIITYAGRSYKLDVKVSNYAIIELRQAEIDNKIANGTMTNDEALTYMNKVKTGSINYALRYHKNQIEPAIVICMDVLDSDYEGKCQLPQDVAEGKINQMLAQTQRAVTEVNSLHP